MSRVTGTWPWMLRRAMVAAGGGAPGERGANRLPLLAVVSEEEWELAMRNTRGEQWKRRRDRRKLIRCKSVCERMLKLLFTMGAGYIYISRLTADPRV